MIGGYSQALESSSRTCEAFKRIKVGRVAVALRRAQALGNDERQGPRVRAERQRGGPGTGRDRSLFGKVGRERNLAVERMG